MSFAIRKFEVACNTGTGNQTISPSDPGLGAAKAAILWGVCLTADGSGANNRFFAGVAESGGGDGCVTAVADDGVATMVGAGSYQTTSAIRIDTAATTPTLDAVATVSTWNSDGSIVVNWSNAPSSAWRLHGLLFYGSEITGQSAGTKTTPAATGNASVTGIGFSPQFVFKMTIASATAQRTNGSHFSWGMLTAGEQASGGYLTTEAAAAANACAQRADRAWFAPRSDGTNLWDSTFVSMDSDGWTENYTTTVAEVDYVYLALDGTFNCKIASETQNTTTGTKSTTAPGFQPAGGIVFGVGQTAFTTVDTTSSECAKLTVGGWDDQGNEGCVWFAHDDGAADAVAKMRTSATKVIQFTSDFTGTVVAEGDITKSATGFDINWTSADATARQFVYAVFGAVPSSGFTIPPRVRSLTGVGY